jgi:4-hydroxybenzoate polyprenyltransferase
VWERNIRKKLVIVLLFSFFVCLMVGKKGIFENSLWDYYSYLCFTVVPLRAPKNKNNDEEEVGQSISTFNEPINVHITVCAAISWYV